MVKETFKGRPVVANVEIHDYAANDDCAAISLSICSAEDLENLILFISRENVQREKTGREHLCGYIDPVMAKFAN